MQKITIVLSSLMMIIGGSNIAQASQPDSFTTANSYYMGSVHVQHKGATRPRIGTGPRAYRPDILQVSPQATPIQERGSGRDKFVY